MISDRSNKDAGDKLSDQPQAPEQGYDELLDKVGIVQTVINGGVQIECEGKIITCDPENVFFGRDRSPVILTSSKVRFIRTFNYLDPTVREAELEKLPLIDPDKDYKGTMVAEGKVKLQLLSKIVMATSPP